MEYKPRPGQGSSKRHIQLKDFRRQRTLENEFGEPIHRQFSLAGDISLAWRNVRYEIPGRRYFLQPWKCEPNKPILKRLTGHVKYQSLNGFMGPSGAGKTTFLNCLNGNIRNLAAGTELYINEDEKKFPKIGFIEQHVHETIVNGLSVWEILCYAFRFKNTRADWHHLNEHISKTLQELLLDPKIVERRFSKCSGGEQKRVAIAQELMSLKKPTFLFVDEPTTGLDSQAALLVMKCLRKLITSYRITILVSIHMPNDEIIRLFDQLYILAKGGICIYAGRREFLRQNLRIQIQKEVEPGRPPIEEYMKIAGNGIEDDNVRKLAEYTLKNENEKLRPFRNRLRFLSSGMPRRFKRFHPGDFYIQLIRFFYIVFIVELPSFLFQCLCYISFYIFMATVFDPKMIMADNCYRRDGYTFNISCTKMMEDSALANTYIGYQAYSILFLNISKLTLGAITFAPLLKVFRNEHRNRWYSMSVFYWSFLLVRFIEMSLYAIVITLVFYFPSGHYHIDDGHINWLRLGNFFWFIWLSCLYMQGFGQLLSILFVDKMEVSMIAAQVLFVALGIVNGYMINLYHMDNQLLVFASDIFGTKYLTNGMLYTFYALDRCNLTTHYSVKLNDLGVNADTIYTDLTQIYIIIVLLRFIAIILMYIRFSLKTKIANLKLSNEAVDDWEVLPIDSSTEISNNDDNNNNQRNSLTELDLSNIQRAKEDSEKVFEEFSRHKIIIGWRNLSLFGSKSIKELRSIEKISKKNVNPNLILRDLNGQFRFGTLNALMGTSGAGKTSFLKVLNARSKTRLSEETKIYLSKYTPIRVCYITQEVSGHLWPGLTAKQSLIYASKLKNVSETRTKDQQPIDHEKIALTLLDELDIQDTANTFVQNCSGGERKRLALAIELTALRMPNLICIDEPTSGLDSNSADIVVDVLRRLVHRHSITIVASIHQPSTQTLMLFDYCYVLARGGVCIFSSNPNDIPQHLLDVPETNLTRETIVDCFPVEELIKFSCYNHNDAVIKSLDSFTKQKIFQYDQELLDETQCVVDGIQINRIRFSLKSVWIQCCRYGIYMKNYLWIYILCYCLLDLSYGIVARGFFNDRIANSSGCISFDEDFQRCYQNEEQNLEQINLANNVKYSLFYICFFLFLILIQSALFFLKESINFFNEHRNGWYSTGTFYLMKSFFDLIPLIPIIFLYVLIVNIYETVLPGYYWNIILLFLLTIIAVQGIGHFLALLFSTNNFDDQQNSIWTIIKLTITSISYFFILTLLANFFNPIKRMHYIYQLLSNFSVLRWIHEANMVLQYGFDRCQSKKEIPAVLYVMLIPIEDNEEYYYHCLKMLLFNLIFYRLASLLLLLKKSNPIKNRRQRLQNILDHHENLIKNNRPINVNIPGIQANDMNFHIKRIQMNYNNDNNDNQKYFEEDDHHHHGKSIDHNVVVIDNYNIHNNNNVVNDII